MISNRTPMILAGIAAVALLGYGSYWATREEQETPQDPFWTEYNQRQDMARAAKQAEARRAPTPTPHPTWAPLFGAEVQEVEQYLKSGGRIEVYTWAKDIDGSEGDAKKWKADAARLQGMALTEKSLNKRTHVNAMLRGVLQSERNVLIWRGSKAKDLKTRRLYRQKAIAKSKELKFVLDQMESDRLKWIELANQ